MNDILANFNFKTVTTAATPTEVTKLDAFKKTQAAIADFTSITGAGKFWMTNLEAQPAQKTVTASGENKFTVTIGRACAKVRLSLGTGVVGSGGTLDNLKFKTKNNPDKMYLMPVYEGANYTGKQLLTPYYGATTQGTYIDGSAQVSFRRKAAYPTSPRTVTRQSWLAKHPTWRLKASGRRMWIRSWIKTAIPAQH